MSLLDSLKELLAVISDVADFEVAEDLTEIYEDIVSRASAMSRKYWKLVKTLAAMEKARDLLEIELNMLMADDLPLD